MNRASPAVNAYVRRAKNDEGFEFVVKTNFNRDEEVVRAKDGRPFESKEAALEGGKDAFFKAWRVSGDKRELRKQLKDILRTRWYLAWWVLRNLADQDTRFDVGTHQHVIEKAAEAEQAYWLLDPGPDSWKQPLPRHHRTKAASEVARSVIQLVNRDLALNDRELDKWGQRHYALRWKNGWTYVEREGDDFLELTGWPFAMAKPNEYVTREGIFKRKGTKIPGWMPGEGPINWPSFAADERDAREKSGITNEKWALKVKDAGVYEP